MLNLDLQKIAQVTNGRLTPASARVLVTGISTDSRSVRPGELFVPLRGEKFDGHDFLAQAVRRGAAACLSEEVIAGFPVPVIQVADTLHALGDLAAACRSGFSGPVVAVTGSSGKTTSKEMLASILSKTAPGLKTEGNFNNLVGLPLTLFRLAPEHRWAVLEMGMSARGEIARLAEIALPDVGVITNIGPAHLATLHGLDGVARAKGELFAALRAGGTAVINADDERVAQLPVANGVRRLLYGFAENAEVRAEDVAVAGSTVSFRLVLPDGAWPVNLAVAGRHNIGNALAAAAAAVALMVPTEAILGGLESFRGGHGRMEVIELGNGAVLIEDTYNANPLSVRAALVALDEMGESGRRFAVLGDMLELGAEAADLHRQIGAEAAQRCDFLFLLGEMAGETAAGARQQGMPAERVQIVASHVEAAERLRALLQSGDRLLVKGSRGMRMEKVGAALRGQDSSLAAGNG
jgi:UDP-N-acetylmuramoyl-tripeptide--D-alanyl-D-alanine ligase